MNYKYNTPENAIISLENAYSNNDLEQVIKSKDFIGEAKFILKEVSSNYDNDDELVLETAELLKLSLIQWIQENGYPNFNNVSRTFSEFKEIESNIFSIVEVLDYCNGDNFLIQFIYQT